MKLKDALENYYYHSGKTSDIVRQLSLAGIALIWLFREQVNGVTIVPRDLLIAGIFIVLSLAFDLFHYATASAIWSMYHRYKEHNLKKEDKENYSEINFEAPGQINLPAIIFYWGKFTLTVIAYIYIFLFLVKTLTSPVFSKISF